MKSENKKIPNSLEDDRAPIGTPRIPALSPMADDGNVQNILNYFETVTVIPTSTQKPKTLWDSIKIYVDSVSAPTVKRLYIYDTKRKTWDYTTLAGMAGVQQQVFTSSGTFNVPTGVRYVKVKALGGGAGGGSTGGSAVGGKSGGGGAYCEELLDLNGVTSVTVTVGQAGTGDAAGGQDGNDGGDTTFGSYLTAGGGKGTGVGGTATGGSLNVRGGSTKAWLQLYGAGSGTNSASLSSDGGGTYYGPGAPGAFGQIASQTSGVSALVYGGGGSGGATGTGGSDAGGGDGKDGLCIVEWVA